MRLDKFMTNAAICSRKDCAAAVKKGRITVSGIPAVRPDQNIDPLTDKVCFDGTPVLYREFHWIMMHKPEGVVSATDDPTQKTVLDLLPENLRKIGLFPCGRLDKNTTGLILLTNDGKRGHALLSPKHHVKKSYRFTVKYPLTAEDCKTLCAGIYLAADSTAEAWTTAPCEIYPDENRMGGSIVLTEGKYHEIKRMMEAVHNQITSLSRVTFGGIPLDPLLAPGEWRYLTAEEEETLKNAVLS